MMTKCCYCRRKINNGTDMCYGCRKIAIAKIYSECCRTTYEELVNGKWAAKDEIHGCDHDGIYLVKAITSMSNSVFPTVRKLKVKVI